MITFEFNIYKKINAETNFGFDLEFIKTIKIKRSKIETARNYLYTKYTFKNHFIERN